MAIISPLLNIYKCMTCFSKHVKSSEVISLVREMTTNYLELGSDMTMALAPHSLINIYVMIMMIQLCRAALDQRVRLWYSIVKSTNTHINKQHMATIAPLKCQATTRGHCSTANHMHLKGQLTDCVIVIFYIAVHETLNCILFLELLVISMYIYLYFIASTYSRDLCYNYSH